MKILLIIYLISIAYYFFSFILLGATIRSIIRKKNIKIQEYSFAERMLALTRAIIVGLIPVVNILFGTVYLFSDKVKEESIKKALERKI